MLIEISRRRLVLSLVTAAVAGGCSTTPTEWGSPTVESTSGVTAAGATHYLVFLDRSTSIGEASKALWLERDLEQLLKALGPGDRLAVYGVDDLTGSAPPLYEAELPGAEGEGMDEQVRYQGQRKRMLTEARSKVRAFLTGDAAKSTDLFAAFGRIPRESRRHRVIVFFSDMRHSTRDFDMEKVPLSTAVVDASFKAASQRFRYSRDLLRDAEVRCHLEVPATPDAPPPTAGKPPTTKMAASGRAPVNDRQSLETYWTAFVRSLGGSLTHFDNAEFRPRATPLEAAPKALPDRAVPTGARPHVETLL